MLNTANTADISKIAVDCAFQVHTKIGPGLLESTYQKCFGHELGKRGLGFETEKPIPFWYDDLYIDAGYRLDFVIENQLIVELKSVEKLIPLHEAQLLTYLKLSGIKTGLLINFNTSLIKDGIKRMSL